MMKQRQFNHTPTIIILVLSIVLTGCCGAQLWWPPETKSRVTVTDLAGKYVYEESGKKVNVTLGADGTFVISDSRIFSGKGTWEIDGSKIWLHYLEPSAIELKVLGYITGEEGHFVIIGGAEDPDSYDIFQRVR